MESDATGPSQRKHGDLRGPNQESFGERPFIRLNEMQPSQRVSIVKDSFALRESGEFEMNA
jgi:hypothetical protein